MILLVMSWLHFGRTLKIFLDVCCREKILKISKNLELVKKDLPRVSMNTSFRITDILLHNRRPRLKVDDVLPSFHFLLQRIPGFIFDIII